MAVTIYIGASDYSTLVRRITGWSLQKRLVAETFSFILDSTVRGAGAVRPAMNAEVLAYHGTDLLFGGRIEGMLESLIGGEGPTNVEVTCRGWEILAEKIIISGTLTQDNIRTAIYGLYLAYLQPKGVTWLGATSGGSFMTSDIIYSKMRLADLITAACKQVNSTWRINGEKEMAVVAPGDLSFPVTTLTEDLVQLGSIRVKHTAYEYANRLIMTSAGTGEAQHSETHLGNGTKVRFALNVEPKAPTNDGANPPVWTYYWPTQVVVGGTPYLLDGSTSWLYDNVEHMVYTSGAAPGAGVTVVIAYTIAFPATVRTWLSTALLSTGAWNRATLEDKMLTSGISDVSHLKAWGDAELSRRAVMPRVISASTRRKGFYPLQSGTVDFPSFTINEDCLLQNVNVRDDGITERTTEHLWYDLELIEGGVPGRQYENLFQEFATGGGGGASVGSSSGTSGTTATTLPVGFTIHLAGHNDVARTYGTTYEDAPEAIPHRFGGPAFAGTWRLRVPMYQLSAGTVEAQLLDQSTPSVLKTVSTTATGAPLSNAFGFAQGTFVVAAEMPVIDILLQIHTTEGSRDVVVGHATLVKES